MRLHCSLGDQIPLKEYDWRGEGPGGFGCADEYEGFGGAVELEEAVDGVESRLASDLVIGGGGVGDAAGPGCVLVEEGEAGVGVEEEADAVQTRVEGTVLPVDLSQRLDIS